MDLTHEQERLLEGDSGEGTQKAMEMVVKLGEYFGAEELAPISMAYLTLGPDNYGVMLNYVKKLADSGARFRTLTFVPGKEGSLEKKENLDLWVRVHRKMGGIITEGGGFGEPDNATMYPLFGQNVVSDGTNVTSYFNGVIGARANNMEPIGQYVCAITGYAPKYGYLTRDGRLGRVLVNVKFKPKNRTDWSALGYYLSRHLGLKWWEVPVLVGLDTTEISSDDLSSFCSSIPTYGPINHFLIVGVSPEARTLKEAFGGKKPEDKIEVGQKEIKEVYQRFSSKAKKPDLISIGGFGPSLPLKDAYQVAKMLDGNKVKVPLTISMNGFTKNIAAKSGLIKIMERSGAIVTEDNFSIIQNAHRSGIKVIGYTNAKACQYSGQQEVDSVLLDDVTLVKVAIKGSFEVS